MYGEGESVCLMLYVEGDFCSTSGTKQICRKQVSNILPVFHSLDYLRNSKLPQKLVTGKTYAIMFAKLLFGQNTWLTLNRQMLCAYIMENCKPPSIRLPPLKITALVEPVLLFQQFPFLFDSASGSVHLNNWVHCVCLLRMEDTT